MRELVMAQQALHTIHSNSRDCSTETGGVLIGTTKQPAILVAGDPGRHAQKCAASFTSDPEHDQQLLHQARRRFGGRVTTLGYWHKHPEGMPAPSGGDLAQARDLLRQMLVAGDADPWLLSLIVQVDHTAEPKVYAYVLYPSSREFAPVHWSAVDQTDEAIRQALQKEPTYLEGDSNSHYWLDPNFRFQNCPIGRRRLEQEQAALETAGYKVQVRQRARDQRISLLVERDGKQYLCTLPVEYPLGMPRIFHLPEMKETFPFSIRPVWNSDLLLAELLTILEQAPQLTPVESSVADTRMTRQLQFLGMAFVAAALVGTAAIMRSNARTRM